MTDPTIKIAGLTAERDYFEDSARSAAASAVSQGAYMLRVTAERDALAAQLAEARAELAKAPKVCAIHSYEHGPGPCMTCGAWPPGTREMIASLRTDLDSERDTAAALRSEIAATCAEWNAARQSLASERAHLAACQTRIAGLEQAADERSAEVARLTAERDELRRQHSEAMKVMASMFVADAEMARLTARVAELEARPVLTEERLRGALFACADGASDAEVRAILAKLGPVTLPLPAQDMAERLLRAFIEHHGTLLDQKINSKDPSGDVRAEAMSRALASLGAPPTSPPAARPVFAGVSASDLDVAYIGGQRECHQRHQGAIRDCCQYAAVAAVLARLKVSLVAPVDPEAFAQRMCSHQHAADPGGLVGWDDLCDKYQEIVASSVRATLTAAGIPVTPERGQ